MATTAASPAQSLYKGNPIKVTVTAALDSQTKKVVWDHEWEHVGKPGKYKGRVYVAPGDYMLPIAFHLDDRTGLNLKFYQDPEVAMYVGAGPACPPPPGNGGQIVFPQAAGAKQLTVSDANTGPAVDLKYALRFDGDANPAGNEAAPYVYDPDLKNGGGGSPS